MMSLTFRLTRSWGLAAAILAINLFTASAAKASTEVSAVRVGTFPDHTRIVLLSNAPVAPRLLTLEGPSRLVIDLPDTQWKLPSASGSVNSRLVKDFSVGLYNPEISRLVLNLASPARIDKIDRRASDMPGYFEYEIRLNEAEPKSRIANIGWFKKPKQEASYQTQAIQPVQATRLPQAPLVTTATRNSYRVTSFDPGRANFGALEKVVRRVTPQTTISPRPIREIVPAATPSARTIPAALPVMRGQQRYSQQRPIATALAMPDPTAKLERAVPNAPRIYQAAPSLAPRRASVPPQLAAQPLSIATHHNSQNTHLHNAAITQPVRTVSIRPVAVPPSAPQATVHRNKPTEIIKAAPLQPLTIAIDPGHGGKDPGTAPPEAGMTEKWVNLAFARTLKAMLDDVSGVKVIMTRSTDKFVSLQDRVAIAKDNGADLLISIHADWFEDPSIKGATAYMLSEEASMRNAEKLVSKMDGQDQIAGIEVDGTREDVVRMLVDIVRRETQTKSSTFAELVVEEFEEVTKVVRGVKPHDLHVLRTADLPAVLIELGYMSNAEDRELLKSEEWRGKTARAVVNALQRWRIERESKHIANR